MARLRQSTIVPPLRFGLGRRIRAALFEPLRALRDLYFFVFIFLVVTLLDTLYINTHYYQGQEPAQSLYQTFQIMILNSSLSFPGHDPYGIVLFFISPISGIAVIAQALMEAVGTKKRDTAEWQLALASVLTNHVIICGLGRNGWRTITALRQEGVDVAIITDSVDDARFIPRVRQLNIPLIIGDATQLQTLRSAGIQRARALISSIDSEQANLEIALAAHQASAKRKLRVIWRSFDAAFEEDFRDLFGEHNAFSVSALAAPTFTAATLARHIEVTLPIQQSLLCVRAFNLQPGIRQQDIPIFEQQHHVRVLARHQTKDQEELIVLGKLDDLHLVTNAQQHSSLAYDFPYQANGDGHIIICGLGKIGFRMVTAIHRLFPRLRIVIVDTNQDPKRFGFELQEQLRNMPLFQVTEVEQANTVRSQVIAATHPVILINGDARQPWVLQAAGVDKAFTVAAVTSNDLVNLAISITARHEHPGIHVVLRLFSDTLSEEMTHRYDINTAYSASLLAAPTTAIAALFPPTVFAFTMDSETMGEQMTFVLGEFAITERDRLHGMSVEALRKLQLITVSITRDNHIMELPAPHEVIAPGDIVRILGKQAAFRPMMGSLKQS